MRVERTAGGVTPSGGINKGRDMGPLPKSKKIKRSRYRTDADFLAALVLAGKNKAALSYSTRHSKHLAKKGLPK